MSKVRNSLFSIVDNLFLLQQYKWDMIKIIMTAAIKNQLTIQINSEKTGHCQEAILAFGDTL